MIGIVIPKEVASLTDIEKIKLINEELPESLSGRITWPGRALQGA